MERPEPSDRHDPVAWARAETITFSARKAKLYGFLAFANLGGFILVLKGMPGHFLWPYVGLILGITLVCLVAVAGFYSVVLISEYFSRKV